LTKTEKRITAIKNMNNYNQSLSPMERKERAKIAGLASGEARRKRSDMRNTLQALLVADLPAEMDDVRVRLEAAGIQPTIENALCYQMLCRAIEKGDVEASRWVRDTSGNKLSENLTVSRADIPFKQLDLSQLSNEELNRMVAELSDE